MAVLVTRPAEQGIALVEQLNKAGIAAIHFPFFRIEADDNLNQLPHKLAQLNAGDYVVAVSKYAVKYAHQALQTIGAKWRADIQYFAIGQGTAERLCCATQQGVTYPFAQPNSEGVLALSGMSAGQLANKKLLLLRGNEGRELFPEQVRRRQGQLEILSCYQRQPLDYDALEHTSIWKRAGINSLLVTSTEILNALLRFVPKTEQNWLKNCTLITISERIAQLALSQGWQRVELVPRPDNLSLCAKIVALAKQPAR